MPTNFPGALDGFPVHTDNVTDVLAAHTNNLQDAVAALQTKVGVNNSADANSIDAKLRSSAVIGAAVAGLGINDIGVTCLMQIDGTATYTTDQVVAANVLRYAHMQVSFAGNSVIAGQSTPVPTGSWKIRATSGFATNNFRAALFTKVSN